MKISQPINVTYGVRDCIFKAIVLCSLSFETVKGLPQYLHYKKAQELIKFGELDLIFIITEGYK